MIIRRGARGRPRWTTTVLLLVAACSGAGDGPAGSTDAERSAGDGPDASAPEDLVEAGTALYRRAEFDSLLALTRSGLTEARARGDSATVAGLLILDAYVAYQRSDYDRARGLGEEALALALDRDAGDDGEEESGTGEGYEELERAYNLLGLIAWQESRFSDAVEHFTRTGEVAADEGAGQTLAAINLGNVHTDLGNLTEARTAFERGLELSRARQDPRREAIALNNLGMLLIRTGTPSDAIPRLEEASRLFKAQGADNFEANALGQIGTAYTALGEIRSAIAILDDAIRLSREQGLRQEEASNLEALAEAYRVAGDYRRALRLYADAEEINREIGLVWEVGSDQRSRARIYEALGDVEGAREAVRAALETHRSVGASWEELADLLLLADLSDQLGERDVAPDLLAQARNLAGGFQARTARVDLALTEARIAERRGDPAAVLRVLDRAAEDLEASDYDVLWIADVMRARAYIALGRLEAAVTAGSRAVDGVEHTRAGLASGFLRSRLVSHRREAYTTLVDAHLQAGDTAAALEVSDAARGRAFLEHLTVSDRETSPRLEEAARLERIELLTQIAEWQEAREYLESFAPDERDEPALRSLSDRIADARAEYEALRVLAVERDTTGATLLGERRVSASRVRASLRDDEVLLEYLVGDASLTVFVVTSTGVRSFERPIDRKDLYRRVRIARGLISSPPYDRDVARESLSGLHALLMEPARGVLAERQGIIVVPDGVLNYLPFAALVDRSSGRHLVEDHTIRLLPSASALPALRGRHAAGSRAAAPRRGTRSEFEGAVAFAPLSRDLPATRDEAEAFRETLAGSRVEMGRSASEARLREALADEGIVHVATHGLLNVRNPTFSRLELTPGSGAPSDDGRLEVHELFTVVVRSPLIFLSGCETGLGAAGTTTFDVGEDYATLAQAFLYAGAGSVVSTLWRIEDEGAAVMASLFYGELARGTDPVEALARAQRTMITEGQYRAPHHWAAYQLTGGG